MLKRRPTSILQAIFKAKAQVISKALIGLTGLCLSSLFSIAAFGQSYTVEINKTKILQLSSPASAVVVGNPAIADISVHSPTMLFIVGRGYGVTNVIVLNEFGQTVLDADIQVGNNKSNSGKRVLLAGQGWKSFDCNPFCQPAPVLGDDPMFVAQLTGKGQVINNTNTPIATTSFSGQPAPQAVISSAMPQFPPTNSFNPAPSIPDFQQMGPSTRSAMGSDAREF